MAVAQSRNHDYLKVCLSPDVHAHLHWYARFKADAGQTPTDIVRGAIAACLASDDFIPPPRRMTKRDEWGIRSVKKPEFDVYISVRHKQRIAEMAEACNVFQSHIVECMLVFVIGPINHAQYGQDGARSAANHAVNRG